MGWTEDGPGLHHSRAVHGGLHDVVLRRTPRGGPSGLDFQELEELHHIFRPPHLLLLLWVLCRVAAKDPPHKDLLRPVPAGDPPGDHVGPARGLRALRLPRLAAVQGPHAVRAARADAPQPLLGAQRPHVRIPAARGLQRASRRRPLHHLQGGNAGKEGSGRHASAAGRARDPHGARAAPGGPRTSRVRPSSCRRSQCSWPSRA
mmetsp:Transcript_26596/g.76659  ORF Transcript_26596/g.76659 Transcript_26596/m.76659 type:complete len:204 (-) Transcript_26596:1946-2557(-)